MLRIIISYLKSYNCFQTNDRSIDIMVRVFINVPGNRGSILGRVIPKTQKMVLDASSLYTQYYSVRIKHEYSNSGKGIAPSLSHRCSSYWKRSLQFTIVYGRPTNRLKRNSDLNPRIAQSAGTVEYTDCSSAEG